VTVLIQYSNPDDASDANTLATATRRTLDTGVELERIVPEPSKPQGVNFSEYEAVFVVGGQEANKTYAFLEDNGVFPPLNPSNPEVVANGVVRDSQTGAETPVFGIAGLTAEDTDKLVSSMTGGGQQIATDVFDVEGVRSFLPGDPFNLIDGRLQFLFRNIANRLPTGVELVGIKTEPDQNKLRFFIRRGGFSINRAGQQLAVSATVIAAGILGALSGIGVTYTAGNLLGLFNGSNEVAEAPSPTEVERCQEQNDSPEELQECLEGKIETRPGSGGGGGPVNQLQSLLVLGVGGAILLQVSRGAF